MNAMNAPGDPWYLVCQVCERPLADAFEEWRSVGPGGTFTGHRECVERVSHERAHSERLQRLERDLRSSLERDRAHPSRCTPGDDGTVVVRPSGTSCGLACAISLMTGEDDDAVMNRVGGDGGE